MLREEIISVMESKRYIPAELTDFVKYFDNYSKDEVLQTIEDLKKEHTVYDIDGSAIANKLGNSKVLNSVVLGVAAKHIGFSKEEWVSVIEKTVPAKTIEINEKAFFAGYEFDK